MFFDCCMLGLGNPAPTRESIHFSVGAGLSCPKVFMNIYGQSRTTTALPYIFPKSKIEGKIPSIYFNYDLGSGLRNISSISFTKPVIGLPARTWVP